MTTDQKGRLIISQEKGGMLRVTLAKGEQQIRVEKMDVGMYFPMGMLYAFDSLYVNAKGPEGTGMYRMRDLDGDDKFEKIELLTKWKGVMTDHGPHEILLGPDKKSLYVLNGNFVKVPDGLAASSPHKNYGEDLLLPRQWDATGWAVGKMAPGACVYRTDPEGKKWELFCGGMRNPYGFDFNAEGELFAFDSDMERHVGTPWNRPTRITHCVSGGEYGWRGGTGKGPTYYPDNLPAAVDIGLSSPTGIRFGTKSNFPLKYKRALFALDWQYGRILAVHMEQKGATYTGSFEEFIVGKPLNVTDLAFDDNGDMLFITGGRGTESKLYRVSYTGSEDAGKNASLQEESFIAYHRIRREMESYHGRKDPKAIAAAWGYLNCGDRWIRYAARIAIESQEIEEWRERAFDAVDTRRSLTALLAVARLGDQSLLPRLMKRLNRFSWEELSASQKLDLLRVYSIGLTRMGRPDKEVSAKVLTRIDALYPASSFDLNRELSELLVFLKSPSVVVKTMGLFAKTKVQEEEMFYAFVLRHEKTGWTPDLRKQYFRWFARAVKFRGGISVPGFVRNIRAEALATLTLEEKKELAAILQMGYLATAPSIEKLKFVKKWKVEDLIKEVKSGRGARASKGRRVFEKVQCLACHQFAGEGGTQGPDITSTASRYNTRDLLETILLPSKVISDQYRDTIFITKKGKTIVGKILNDEGGVLSVQTDPLSFKLTKISKENIAKQTFSTVSSMPEGLLDVLTKEEIVDLLKYIQSGGKGKFRTYR